jgi:hypothetical protein
MSGIDLGNAFTINGVNGTQALKIAGSSDILTIDTTGRTYYPTQIGFIAGISTDPGWIALTGGAWNRMTHFNTTVYNQGGGYASSRFTAPVAGAYLFHWTGYQYKPSAVAGNYIHPKFWVNGGDSHVSMYRLKAYETPAGYSFVGEIADIFSLNAGDFVDPYIYSSATGISLYHAYTQFSGILVG